MMNVMLAGGDLRVVDKNGDASDQQTEADRAAQFCIVKSLQNKFGHGICIIGEEETTSYTPQLEASVDSAVLAVDGHCSVRDVREEDLVIWVDPLDGTSELTVHVANQDMNHLHQVTVLIGIAHKGNVVAGVIHQPYWGTNAEGRTVWAIKGAGVHGIQVLREASDEQRVVVTTRSHSNTLVMTALNALETASLCHRVDRVGGAGYKVLRVLEGAAAYVFASGGCKKWDTAAAEAVLSEAGGKLTDVSGRAISYFPEVQKNNSGGVVATAPWVNHSDYISNLPQSLKDQLPETTN